eukprot:362388-Chlamydomonas_euryale.AAC.7
MMDGELNTRTAATKGPAALVTSYLSSVLRRGSRPLPLFQLEGGGGWQQHPRPQRTVRSPLWVREGHRRRTEGRRLLCRRSSAQREANGPRLRGSANGRTVSTCLPT